MLVEVDKKVWDEISSAMRAADSMIARTKYLSVRITILEDAIRNGYEIKSIDKSIHINGRNILNMIKEYI